MNTMSSCWDLYESTFDPRSTRIEGMTATCFVPLCVLLIGDAMEFISNRFTGSFYSILGSYHWRAVEILPWSSSQVLTLCPQRYGFAGSCRWRYVSVTVISMRDAFRIGHAFQSHGFFCPRVRLNKRMHVHARVWRRWRVAYEKNYMRVQEFRGRCKQQSEQNSRCR
jgi:hypothetical protein